MNKNLIWKYFCVKVTCASKLFKSNKQIIISKNVNHIKNCKINVTFNTENFISC